VFVAGLGISLGSILLPLVFGVPSEMVYPILPLAIMTLSGSIMISQKISLLQLIKFSTMYFGGLCVAGAGILSIWMFPVDRVHTLADYAWQMSPVGAVSILMVFMSLFYYAVGEATEVKKDAKKIFLMIAVFALIIGLGSIKMQGFSPALVTVPFGVGVGVWLMMKGKMYTHQLRCNFHQN